MKEQNKIRVVLGLGANLPLGKMPPHQTLAAAAAELAKILQDAQFSSIYKTRAMYVTDQEDFFNMAAAGFVASGFGAHELLRQTQKIEAQFGRDRSREIRFGPRTLDIDIELFGSERVTEPDLTIPHPRLEERAFVLVPMLEILTLPSDNEIRERYAPCINCGLEKFMPPPA